MNETSKLSNSGTLGGMDVSLEVEGENDKGRFYLHRPEPPAENKSVEIEAVNRFLSRSIAQSTSSEFNIDLVYTGDSAYQWAFDRAIERWEQVITADLPDTRVTGSVTLDSINFGYLSNQLIDDVRIYGAVQYIDGPGGTLGAAGPRYVRGWDSVRGLPDGHPH